MSRDADATLRDLAHAYGVQTEWRDAWGKEHLVDLDTLRMVLAALGVAAQTPGAAAEALADHHAEQWVRRLPSLLTADAGRVRPVEISLATERAARDVEWVLTAPDGAIHRGRAVPEIVARGAGGERCLARLHVPMPGGWGYGHLRLGSDDEDLGATQLALAPQRAFWPQGLASAWGVAVQLPGLRTPGDGGLGHYGSLAAFASGAAEAGAAAVAVSPVHALFAGDPSHCSPYSPSDRRFLNAALVDPAGVPGLEGRLAAITARVGLDGALAACEATALIDYDQAVRARLALLRAIFDEFGEHHLGASPSALGQEFAAFRQAQGVALEDHARFETLHAHFFASDPQAWNWHRWTADYRDPRSPSVAAFARDHARSVAFHAFLQWLAARQLAASDAAGRKGGLGIGLIADLAVGTHPGGSRAWAEPDALLAGLSLGAPPDIFSPLGQDWGITTFSPSRLAVRGFAPFRDDLSAAMRFAGGIRIDHILGLARIWCVPAGALPAHGAYLRMPFDDLARLVALESHRHECLVIGEDLGTLPEGLHDALDQRGILGIRVLWFERDAGGHFAAPEHYPSSAIATLSTHDLPTLVGWWNERDIDWRDSLGLLGADGAGPRLRAERRLERAALWQALLARRLVEGETPPDRLDVAAAAAVAAHMGLTPSPLVLMQLEDLLLEEEQANLPGTTTQHPNWRRRLPASGRVDFSAPPARLIITALAAARRHGAGR